VSAAREDDTSKDSASSISKSGMNCEGSVWDLKSLVRGTVLEGDHDSWNKNGDLICSNRNSRVFYCFFSILAVYFSSESVGL
jgi:hypothetical protein